MKTKEEITNIVTSYLNSLLDTLSQDNNYKLDNELKEFIISLLIDAIYVREIRIEKLEESFYVERCVHSGCPYLHYENRNCSKVGGFYTSVSNKNCPMMQNLNSNLQLFKSRELLIKVLNFGLCDECTKRANEEKNLREQIVEFLQNTIEES